MGGRALLPERTKPVEHVPNLLDLLKERDIRKGERIYHPLFGTGWVESVEAQALRRKDGAEAVFASVRFDIGQTCKFRFIRRPGKQRVRARSRRRSEPSPFKDSGLHKPSVGEREPDIDPQDVQILRELGAGKSTREIAQDLGISPTQLASRLKAIFRRLGVSTGTEALPEARRRGLLG